MSKRCGGLSVGRLVAENGIGTLAEALDLHPGARVEVIGAAEMPRYNYKRTVAARRQRVPLRRNKAVDLKSTTGMACALLVEGLLCSVPAGVRSRSSSRWRSRVRRCFFRPASTSSSAPS